VQCNSPGDYEIDLQVSDGVTGQILPSTTVLRIVGTLPLIVEQRRAPNLTGDCRLSVQVVVKGAVAIGATGQLLPLLVYEEYHSWPTTNYTCPDPCHYPDVGSG
jgi:hypothetical protein